MVRLGQFIVGAYPAITQEDSGVLHARMRPIAEASHVYERLFWLFVMVACNEEFVRWLHSEKWAPLTRLSFLEKQCKRFWDALSHETPLGECRRVNKLEASAGRQRIFTDHVDWSFQLQQMYVMGTCPAEQNLPERNRHQ